MNHTQSDCPLILNNTLTRRREVFSSREQGVVRLFTCGPSVYRRPHLGNYRTFLYEDVLQRYLTRRGYSVHRVIVATDVEDKAIDEAADLDLTLSELTDRNLARFRTECEALGIVLPETIARASTSVDVAVRLIEQLLEKGVAYHHDGDVFYDPLKYPRFGEIFGLDMSDWPTERRRFAQDTYEGNRWNRGDFILWHGKRDGDAVWWESSIGPGRPSWNVQDPAMCVQQLGYEIDIHCGGIDNIYRHHDYNRAVIEGITGREFCHYWLHGEHVIVDGVKMSKSKGNVLYLEQMAGRGITPREVRFLLIYGHYRDQLDVTDELIDDRVRRIRGLRADVDALLGGEAGSRPDAERANRLINELPLLFDTAMNDDLHVGNAVDSVAGALAELRTVAPAKGLSAADRRRLTDALTAMDTVIGAILLR